MKIIGRIEGITADTMILKIDNIRHAQMMQSLPKDRKMSIEIDEVKNKRSAEQNRYMWALLHDIDEAINGAGASGEWDLYCDCLERAGAKFEYVMCRTEAEKMLKTYFRAVKYAMPAETDGMAYYKCFYGSSKMNSKEMTVLIDRILDLAAEAGIETSYWRSILK